MTASHEDILIAVARVEVAIQEHSKKILDHEDRMRVLEEFKAKIAGYAMAGAAIGSVLVQVLFKFVH